MTGRNVAISATGFFLQVGSQRALEERFRGAYNIDSQVSSEAPVPSGLYIQEEEQRTLSGLMISVQIR